MYPTAFPLASVLLSALIVTTSILAFPTATERNSVAGTSSGSSFSVSQVRNSKYVANGPFAYAKALKKFGVVFDDDLVSSLASIVSSKSVLIKGIAGTASAVGESGTVIAAPEQYDKLYLSPVSIGTPPQILYLDIDTGSADLWVFSSLTASTDVAGQLLYNPTNSTTAVSTNSTWSITYGDGSSSEGKVFNDVVTIGTVSFASQAVEAATLVSDDFTTDSHTSGLVGLSFSSINTVRPKKVKTWFDNVMSSLASPVFTVNLKKNAIGNYNFGYINQSEYTGAITYVPVNSASGFWQFTGIGYAVGSNSFVEDTAEAIIDTGTSLILMPSSVVKAYYLQVDGSSYSNYQAGYIFPCNATLPDFTVGIGDYKATVPGRYFNYATISKNSCYGGIQSVTGVDFAIYGDVFLKAQFVVFDADKIRLGFADLVHIMWGICIILGGLLGDDTMYQTAGLCYKAVDELSSQIINYLR